ncbi:hypothetical protein BH09PAT3_BH09PAT3_3980 [soil metagenome]
MPVKKHKRRPKATATILKPSTKKAASAPKSDSTTAEPVKPATPTTPHVIPSVMQLSKQSLGMLRTHKALFGTIVAIYGLLNIIFVTGLGGSVDVAAIRNEYSSQFIGGLSAYTQLISTSTTSSDKATGVYQFLLFILVSLALIWALREVYAKNKIKARDAYYKGMYPLVPCLIVLAVICLQLLPVVIGSSVYQAVVTNGTAKNGAEIITWATVAIALSLVSLYFLASSIFAFYIASLPDMAPRQALRSAKKLVKGRRWMVLRKLLFLPVVLMAVMTILILPLAILIPILAPFGFLLLGPLLIAIAHSYLYTLYRELMHD